MRRTTPRKQVTKTIPPIYLAEVDDWIVMEKPRSTPEEALQVAKALTPGYEAYIRVLRFALHEVVLEQGTRKVVVPVTAKAARELQLPLKVTIGCIQPS